MKLPKYRDVKELNKRLAKDKDRLIRTVLASALSQYARLSGDLRGLGHLRSRSYGSLLVWAKELVAQKYATASLHFAAHQVSALIRKYPWDPKLVGTDPEGEAIKSFLRGEHRCRRVNQWFRIRRVIARRRRADEWEIYFERMRNFIRYVIKDSPDLAAIYAKADFTGGANVGVHGDATNLARKLLASSWTVTPTALPYFAAALSNNFHFATKVAKGNSSIQSLHVSVDDVVGHARLVSANKIAFVLKDAWSHRTIATEPLGNGCVQKGTDEVMRDDLKRVKINLQDQTLNQRMAREGSLSDGEEDFVTLDLKNASNSNALEMVKEVTPRDWFLLWDRLRSPCYSLPGTDAAGKPPRYEMIASMGNGFCFPLETLIFAAACHAVGAGKPGEDFSVYGDDIIVRKKHSALLIRLLGRLGFQLNTKKSLVSGPYRESCGSNWYNGEDVTPFTLDFALDSLQALFKFMNLSRRNERTTLFLEDARRAVLARIPDQFLFWRPFKGAPDTGIDPPGVRFTQYWQRNRRVKHEYTAVMPSGEIRKLIDYASYQSWSWVELESSPVKDEIMAPAWVVMAAAVRGHPSNKPFTFRRKVETRLCVRTGSSDLAPLDTTRVDELSHAASRFWAARGGRPVLPRA